MAASVSEDSVRQALRLWVGMDVIDNTSISREAVTLLRRYSPFRQSLSELRDAVETLLLGILHRFLGVSMSARMEDGCFRRILMRDIVALTDDLVGILFDSLAVYSVNYELISAYSLSHESLAALRVLYQKYEQWMKPDERAVLAAMIRRVYPKERYEQWLCLP